MKQPKILVTGATGKTGSAVVDQLLLAKDVNGRPMFVLPLLRENKTPGCSIHRVLENDFVVETRMNPRACACDAKNREIGAAASCRRFTRGSPETRGSRHREGLDVCRWLLAEDIFPPFSVRNRGAHAQIVPTQFELACTTLSADW